jgi:hypothetical protein
MHISQESTEQTEARIARVLAHAEFTCLGGSYAFEEFALADFPGHAHPEAVACVRDDHVWSQLVPSHDATKELFTLFRFHFAEGLDNSGFVGWLATHLKQTLGTGVFVVCGQNTQRGGILDYWGCPVELGDAARAAIERVIREGTPPRGPDLSAAARTAPHASGCSTDRSR